MLSTTNNTPNQLDQNTTASSGTSTIAKKQEKAEREEPEVKKKEELNTAQNQAAAKKKEDTKEREDRELVNRNYTFNQPYQLHTAALSSLSVPARPNSQDPALKVSKHHTETSVVLLEEAERRKAESAQAVSSGRHVVDQLRSTTASNAQEISDRIKSAVTSATSTAVIPGSLADLKVPNGGHTSHGIIEAYRQSALAMIGTARGTVLNYHASALALEQRVASNYTLVTDLPSLDTQIELRKVAFQLIAAYGDLRDHEMATDGQFRLLAAV